MAVAAFVISVVAILVAGWSAWFTREQARHAKRSADIESERRADELADRQKAELAQKSANLYARVQRQPNTEGSIAEGPYRYSLVVANDGPAEAHDLTVEILSVWNGPGMSIPRFVDGTRVHRVGRLPIANHEEILLADDPEIDFDDFGECVFKWRDDAHPDGATDRSRAAPDWL